MIMVSDEYHCVSCMFGCDSGIALGHEVFCECLEPWLMESYDGMVCEKCGKRQFDISHVFGVNPFG